MNVKSKIATFAAASIFALSLGATAMAAESTVTQEITKGQITASLSDASLETLAYSHAEQTNEGTLHLQVNDLRGTYEGWTVSVESGAFIYDGTVSGDHDIAATNFALTNTAAPVLAAGKSIDGVKATGSTGTLNTGKNVVQANGGSGSGKYTQDLGVALTVPADSPAGTYVATLTVAITSAPGTTAGE